MQSRSFENNNLFKEIAFSEIEDAIKHIFDTVWIDSRGISFAKKCWNIFIDEGLNKYTNEMEKCLIGIRIISLGEIYREFNGIAFDEYIEPNYEEWADLLGITKFRIGQIIGNNTDYINDDEFKDYICALGYLANQARNTVYDVLLKGFNSKDQLFYELYLTGLPDEQTNENNVEEEFDDSFKTPDIQDVLNDFDIASGKFEAYSWVSDGCFPYY